MPSPLVPPEASGRLAAFVAELPIERGPIVTFVAEMARAQPPGARVLDAGGGDAPYREMFAHVHYVTADWPQSVHEGAARSDIVASLDDLPVTDGSFDSVLSTQVLEHVPDPGKVLSELFRVLCPGGRLWLTAPLVWPLHEEPFDFYRYTSFGLRTLLVEAGFADVEVEPRNGYFGTMAELMRAQRWMAAGVEGDRSQQRRRRRLGRRMERLASQIAGLDALDTHRTFPLGYTASARRPG